MKKAIPSGENIIGFSVSKIAKDVMRSMNPATMKEIEGEFHEATSGEIDVAMEKATKAFQTYRNTTGTIRAKFLRKIADNILSLGDPLIERAMAESGLPKGRLEGERGRTIGQLRMFADLVEEGSWVEASIDTAILDRQPFPKADIRKKLVPVGVVVVFTASNFPLAFSTAGGDTASALAAGNPVVVKAHESHLGTNSMVAAAIQNAAMVTNMPDGVFSSLNGTGLKLGQALVRHPLTKTVAFTGSYRAGKALFDTANQREIPIPVFSEMGSINPVILLPKALENRNEPLANQYVGSVNLGAGQFCTNPGLLIGMDNEHLDSFIKHLVNGFKKVTPSTMLNENVCKNYEAVKTNLLEQAGVKMEAVSTDEGNISTGRPTVASVSAGDFLKNKDMQEEVFGPFTLIVKCQSEKELMEVVLNMQGQLTATVMGEEEEFAKYYHVIDELKEKAGRISFNNVPTGVEVCHSMHHGGPFPATTDSRFTSVGTGAIKRFARPLCYQNWQSNVLPLELKDENLSKIWRLINGEWTKKSII
ncbi:MAG: aldehyde dehydrogenase (NADP(+)) [Saprospiraceae bacterium]|jgi:alpha-ketoglutaric semialdehyde dehydrogenase|nr:aldehyde dehydrogenase (NADP(+)) [Saprospiraceae bacterium]MDG1435665.1 aldehyde dehydrogenase (NADP(+)) [Saprospiraceae bacterium]MDG2418452.1 aldehyde dehydrogenase (NADP(+)) [Saprospiraceae bacterium]